MQGGTRLGANLETFREIGHFGDSYKESFFMVSRTGSAIVGIR